MDCVPSQVAKKNVQQIPQLSFIFHPISSGHFTEQPMPTQHLKIPPTFFTNVPNPIGSMYGIFTYIWLIFMVNVGKYTIHGSYGNVLEPWRIFTVVNSSSRRRHPRRTLKCWRWNRKRDAWCSSPAMRRTHTRPTSWGVGTRWAPKNQRLNKWGEITPLGGGFKYLLFSLLFGEDFQFD